MKRFLHRKYLLALVLQLCFITGFAQSWNGGSGTAGDPYQIATVQQLTFLQTSTNANTNYTNVYFKLMNSLDLGGSSWAPIGTSARPFRGNFDGNSHTVSGLFINTSINDVGLFGSLTNGAISNLGVLTASGGVKGNNNVGILLGSQSGGTITNCFTMGAVAGNDAVGGLIGNQTGGTVTVSQCFAIADVTGGAGLNGSAGLVGVVRGNLNNSYAWGNVKGNGSVAGLGGALSTNGVVNSSYAMGNATSSLTSRIGGLAGFITQTSARLQNSVAINGTLTSTGNSTGRVVGQSNLATAYTNNYAIDNMVLLVNGAPKTVNSNENGIDGGSQSKATLNSAAFYSGTLLWSIAAVNDNSKLWNIWEGVSYPYLQRQSSPVSVASFSGTSLQGAFRPDVLMDSILVYLKNGSAFTRLGATFVNNFTHTWSYTDPALAMNGVVYILAYESGKAWPSYPVSETICGITPTFDVSDKTTCAPAINLQSSVSNLQNAGLNDVQFSKAGGVAFDANIIPSPVSYSVKGTQTIYARVVTPLGCRSDIKSFQVSQTGSLVFKEDFGAGAACSSTPLGSNVTTYAFGGDLHTNGRYGICSQLSNYYEDYWHFGTASYDHTNPGTGRALIVNADFDPGKFYTLTINDLCPGTRLNFSAWVANLVNPNASATNFYMGQGVTFNDPDLLFELRDANTNALLAQYSTGSIPKVTNPANNWRSYGFDFTVGTSSSVTLTLYNNAPGGNGNDLMIDDIEVYLCAPPVSITAPTEEETVVCGGDAVTLTGTYTDDGTLGNDITYRWIRSATGNVNNPADWTTVFTGAATNPLTASYAIPSMGAANEGYYRLVVGTPGSIDSYNCTAKSNPIHLTYRPRVASSNISVAGATAICAGASTSLTASPTGITIANPVYRWYDSQTAAAPVFTGQTYQTPVLTTSATYYVSISGDKHCENATGDRYEVAVTVAPLPTAGDITVITDATICSDNSAILTVTTSAGMVARWYGDAGLTNFLFEGNTYTTPVLTTSTTYYAIAKNISLGCMGDTAAAKPVVVTVNPRPVADFDYFADDANPFVMHFTDNSSISAGSIASWLWNFGDDSTSTLQNPQHPYALPEGNYTVRLIATSNTGCADTVAYVIHVGKTPYAKFSVNDTTQCFDGNAFEFTNLSSISVGEIPQTTYLWTFGDGTQSATEHPVHQYASAGAFTVKLVVNMAGLLDSTTMNVTVNPSPALVAKTNATICTGESVDLRTLIILMVGNSGVFYADRNGSPLANITVSPTDTTQYYIQVTDLSTLCQSWDSVTVNVNALPSLSGKRDTTVCAGQPVDLNTLVALEANTTAAFYTSISGAQVSPAVVNPVVSTQYYVKITGTTTGCEAWDSVTVSANPLPTRLEIISITNSEACYGTSALLFAATASGDFVPQWYSDSALTNLLFEGNGFLTPTLTATTTYYVAAKNSITGCRANASEAKLAVATVNPLPVFSDIDFVVHAASCGSAMLRLSAEPLEGFSARWYADSTLTEFLFEGNDYTTPLLTSTTTYYVVAKSDTTGCVGDPSAAHRVTATINLQPTAGDILSVRNDSICGQGTATLSATPATGFIARWYSDAALTTFLFEGNSYTTPLLTTSTTYYVVAKNDTTGCSGAATAAKPVVATVSPLPTINDILSVRNDSICGQGTATLSATPATGFIARWYSDAALTTFLFEGNSYTTPVINTSTTYYVVAKNISTNCIGDATAAKPVVATVNPLPVSSDILELSQAVSCGENAVTLTAYYFQPDFVARWYADAALTNFLFEGDNFHTPFLTTTTTYYVAVRNLNTGCIGDASSAIPATATIYPLPAAGDIVATSGASICVGNTAVLSATPASGFVAQWYADTALTTFLFEGNNYTTPVLNASTTYYVVARNQVTSCTPVDPAAAKAVTATVTPMPTASDITTVTGATICGPGSVTLSATPAAGFVARWYSDAALTTFLFEGSSYTTPVINTSTTYYVVAKNTSTNCIGDATAAKPVVATVSPLPQNTDFRAITSTSVCKGGRAGLFASVEPGFVPRWYSDSELTNFLFEGNSFITPPLDTTTTYYVVPKNLASGCIGLPSAASTATATVNPLPTINDITAVTGADICGPGSVTLSATPATGFAARWYSDAALTTFLFEGSSYTTPVLSTTTTYYVVARNTSTSCIGNATAAKPVVATVNPQPTASDITAVTGADICGPGSVTLSATPASGFAARWYSDAALTTFLFEGSSYTTPVLTTTTTYYVVARNIATGCIGNATAAKPVVATVNPQPTTSDITAVTGADICGPGSVTLSATPASGFSARWYSDAALTTFLFEGSSYTTPVLTTTTTYYVVAKNIATGCIGNATAAKPVVATVNPQPTASDITTVTGADICGPGSVTLSATPATGFAARWYSDAALTTFLFEGSSYTTPVLTTTTTYYVVARNTSTSCIGNATAAKPVVATVNPQPTASDITTVTGAAICADNTATITATAATGFIPRWYSDAALTNLLAEGVSYTTPILNAATTYYVVAKNIAGGCIGSASAAKQVSVVVNQPPTLPTLQVVGKTTIERNTSTTLEVVTPVAGTIRWYEQLQPYQLLHEGASYTTPILTENATYYLRLLSPEGCESSMQQEVAVTVGGDIAVAEAITPNGDGYNDTWIIRNIENYPNNRVTVYNRWGDKVYEKAGYTNSPGWDTYANVANRLGKGRVPRGTYFYTVHLNDEGRRVFKGSIEIIY